MRRPNRLPIGTCVVASLHHAWIIEGPARDWKSHAWPFPPRSLQSWAHVGPVGALLGCRRDRALVMQKFPLAGGISDRRVVQIELNDEGQTEART